jgi:endonuclease YncB( thermonuclease family)
VTDDTNNAGQPFRPTTQNFNQGEFPDFFLNRDGLGLELDPSESYEVEVVSVTDGDTVDVAFDDPDNTRDTVRIVGIDTPETGSTDERLQEYEGIDDGSALKTEADNATDYAVDQLAGETVTLSFDEGEGLRGNFGRLLGVLELSDGSVYNANVIEDGWARVYDSGLGQHDAYWELEQDARANDRGIWSISDPAATPEVGDDPVEELFFPEPVEVTGPETPVLSENGEPLVALDTDANVAAIGGPLIEEAFEVNEGGPGIDDYGVYPFLTNVIDALGTGTGPVIVDGGHGQFASDFAVSAEDTAYYLRYLEGQSPGDEAFIGLEGVVEVASDPGPDLLDGSDPAARALIVSTPATKLTPAERSEIVDFANAGGAVVMLGTAADTGALGNFDPLLSDLGTDVGFTTDPVTDATNNLDGDPSNPTTTNFDETGGLFGSFTPGNGSVAPDVTITELDDGEEYVVIENQGSTDTDLDGWTLSDSDGDVFGFPADTLSPGETAVVTTRQTAADAPPETDYIYDWGSPGSNGYVWGSSGDTATISDADGDVVDTFSY